MMRRKHRPILALFAAVTLGGCYRYVAAPTPDIVPRTHVRMTLQQPVAPALRAVLGEGTVGIEGQVTGSTDSDYMVTMAATLKPGTVSNVPSRIVWAGESVTIPRAAVNGVELRSLDRGRTARAVAVAAVAAVVVVKVIVSSVGSSGGGDDGGPIVTPP